VLQALVLLRDSDARLIDVCFDSGFGSLPAFYRSFARLVGVPPSTLRAAPGFSRRRHSGF
jgi:AraC-like DNA-binding protein